MKKQLLLLLSLLLCAFSMASAQTRSAATAFPNSAANSPRVTQAPVNPPSIRVMGHVLTSSGNVTASMLKSGTVHYDADKKELTLDNAVVEDETEGTFSSSIPGLKIILKGKNQVSAKQGTSFYIKASTTITGDELKVSSSSVCILVQNWDPQDTIKFTISNCTLDLVGSAAINALSDNKSGSTLIFDNAKVHAKSLYNSYLVGGKAPAIATFQKYEFKDCYIASPEDADIVETSSPIAQFYTPNNYDIGLESEIVTELEIVPGEKPIITSDLTCMGKPLIKDGNLKGAWLKKGYVYLSEGQFVLYDAEIEYDNDVPFLETSRANLPIFYGGNCKITSKSRRPVMLLHQNTYLMPMNNDEGTHLTLESPSGVEAISIVPETKTFLYLKGKQTIKGDIAVHDTLQGQFNNQVRMYMQDAEVACTGKVTGFNSFTFAGCHISVPLEARLEEVRQSANSTAWRLIQDGEEVTGFQTALGEAVLPHDALSSHRITLTTTKKVGETITLLATPASGLYVEGATPFGSVFKNGLQYNTYKLTRQQVVLKGSVSSLRCEDNQLTQIDLSNTNILTDLVCSGNQLKNLNVNSQRYLVNLLCANNQLSTLNVSNNKYLSTLNCENNQISALNTSENAELKLFNCANNQISALDVTSNTKLTMLSCYGNNLKEPAMDVLVNSLPHSKGKLVVLDIANDGNIITKEQVQRAETKGWEVLDTQKTPVGISAHREQQSIEVFDLSGRRTNAKRAEGLIIVKQGQRTTKQVR